MSDLNKAVNYWKELKDLLNNNRKYVFLNITNEWYALHRLRATRTQLNRSEAQAAFPRQARYQQAWVQTRTAALPFTPYAAAIHKIDNQASYNTLSEEPHFGAVFLFFAL